MPTYLSNEELQAIRDEISITPDSVSIFTLSLPQARKLVNEALSARGMRTAEARSTGVDQIDLFDTSKLY